MPTNNTMTTCCGECGLGLAHEMRLVHSFLHFITEIRLSITCWKYARYWTWREIGNCLVIFIICTCTVHKNIWSLLPIFDFSSCNTSGQIMQSRCC